MMHSAKLRTLLLGSIVTFAACDTPVSPHDDFDEEPVGVEITRLDGTVIATFEDDVWTFTSGDALQLETGAELAVRIRFIAEDGDRFELPHSGAEHTLQVVVANAAIATYAAHADHGDFLGVTAGETTASIEMYHGSHADWRTTPPLPIEVVAPAVQ